MHRLDGFRGNPATVWELKHPPLHALSLAFVLHYESEKLIRVSCAGQVGAAEEEADYNCRDPGTQASLPQPGHKVSAWTRP